MYKKQLLGVYDITEWLFLSIESHIRKIILELDLFDIINAGVRDFNLLESAIETPFQVNEGYIILNIFENAAHFICLNRYT